MGVLKDLLLESRYDAEETWFLVDGFTNGFDIGYQGPVERQSTSENIPLTVGTQVDLWTKIMTEVKCKRVAGPFEPIPFKNFIESPVGLVPKAGRKTRMIFHLSFNFHKGKEGKINNNSLNACTPKELCTVRYNDLDAAVSNCLHLIEHAKEILLVDRKERTPVVFLGKTDLSSAFWVLPLKVCCYCWLIFKAKDPQDGKSSILWKSTCLLGQV